MSLTVCVCVIVVLVIFSAFFSSSEIAYTSLNEGRLDGLAKKGKISARLALFIYNHFRLTLSGILIGNSLVNIAASSVTTLFVVSLLRGKEGLATTLATLIITVIILIFGEIAPKIIGKKKALSFACAVSFPLFAICMVIFMPVTVIVDFLTGLISRLWKKKDEEEPPTVTENEFKTMIETAEEENVLDEASSDLLQSALAFSETTVEEILVPRINVEGVEVDEDFEEIKEIAENTRFSRLVVYEETVDHIIGVLYLNHFYKTLTAGGNRPFDLRPLLIVPTFVHKTMKLPAVFSAMKRDRVQMAVVLDEYGGTLGIVTMEDILEELVGEIWDETDDIETDVTTSGDDTYEVDGTTGIYDFFEYIDFDERDFDSEYTTMGGWAIEMLDADPHEGDSFTYRNLYVIVTSMSDNLVTGLTVRVLPEEEPED